METVAVPLETPLSISASPVTEVTIVSANGRGDWLATELAHRGWKATLIDVSDSLPQAEPEDAEGPFGWFEAADLLPSQAPLHMDSEEMIACERGFILWLRGGPIEFGSAVTEFQLKKFQARGVPAHVESYLRHQGLPSPQAVRDLKSVAQLEFREAWLAHLAHQLASPVVHESHRALEHGWALPLFAPLWIRRATKKGALASLSHAQTSGATVITGLKPKHIRFDHRDVAGVELEGESATMKAGSGQHFVGSRILIWTLTSAETLAISPDISKTLFPKGSAAPSWFWARSRVEFKSSDNSVPQDSIPAFSVVLGDPFLPWNGANMFILRQRKESLLYDAWARLPVRAASDAHYLSEVASQIQKNLTERLPSFSPEVTAVSAPIGVPVFSSESLDQLSPLKAANLFFCGPEQWQTLDALGRSRHQYDILVRLDKIKAQWTVAELRASARQSAGKPASTNEKRGDA